MKKRGGENNDLFRLQKLSYNARLVKWSIVMQKSEILQTCLWAVSLIVLLKYILHCDSFTFRHRNLHDWTLVIKEYHIQTLPHGTYSFSNARAACVFDGPDSIIAFSFGFEKIHRCFITCDKIVKSLSAVFCVFFNKYLAFSTRDLFWSSVSKWGIHLAI